MKVYIALTGFIFLISCKQVTNFNNKTSEQQSNTKTWLIHLDNNLGQLKIKLPERFDTTFRWVEYSDCSGCEHIGYRIQSKTLRIFKESGFIYYPLEDSVEQFTIKHQIRTNTFGSTENDFKPLSVPGGPLSWMYGKEQIVLDTQLIVKRRYFNIEAARYFDSSHKTRNTNFNAVFLVKNNLLKLSFEYRKSYLDSTYNSFIQESLNAIKTIEIL